MRHFKFTLLALSIFFTIYACNSDKATNTDTNTDNSTDTPSETIEVEEPEEKGPKTYYVMAPSGLNLRGTANPKSEKITKVPYGAAVIADAPSKSADDNMTIEGLNGHMLPVSYGNHKGFIFDGFLSSIPVPNGVNKQKYVTELKRQGFDANYEFQLVDEEETLTEDTQLTFPAADMQEAFTIAKKFNFFSYNNDDFKFQAAYPDPSLKGVLMNTKKGGIESLKLKENAKDEDGNEVEKYEYNHDTYWLEAYFNITYDSNRQPIKFEHEHRSEGGGATYWLYKKDGDYVLISSAFAD